MNKSTVKANEMKRYTLRLEPDLYKTLRYMVYTAKDKEPGYSINQYITELILKDLDYKGTYDENLKYLD